VFAVEAETVEGLVDVEVEVEVEVVVDVGAVGDVDGVEVVVVAVADVHPEVVVVDDDAVYVVAGMT
jgi:hypothetical protein